MGVGGHDLRVVQACEKAKVPCDFYVKTFHSTDYPTATRNCDNHLVHQPQGDGRVHGQSVAKPWIAFKVLAAGAIFPRQAFPYAFRNGADFIAVGMFDFQIKEDCEIVRNAVRRNAQRKRPWYA